MLSNEPKTIIVRWPKSPKAKGGSKTLGFSSTEPPSNRKSTIFDLFSLVAPQPEHLAKIFQLTLIGSPLRAFQWAQGGHRLLSLSPQKVAQNAKCPKFEQQAAITPKRYEIGCQLLTNRKSILAFVWYLPRWPWMTLSAVIALILLFLTEFDCFAGHLRQNGWRLTYNACKYCLPVLVFHFWP